MAKQLAFARRKSTRLNYQAKWKIYRGWCRREGHSISRPSVAKVADFLLYLRKISRLSFSAIASYRSMLSSVFRFSLPEISSSPILKDLLRSFRLERPISPRRAPPWDLARVLKLLGSPVFEPLSSLSLRELTKKTVFLLALASARRVSELQAVSKSISIRGNDVALSFLPEFQAKTESEGNPLPRSFLVKSLKDFVGDLEDELHLCPVRALLEYVRRTRDLKVRPRNLLVSPRNPSRPLSKNALSYFLREVISSSISSSDSSGASVSDPGPSVRHGAHSIRGMATSVAFFRNYSVSSLMESATWKTPSVFTSFYLRDIQFQYPDGFGLGPFVAANSV